MTLNVFVVVIDFIFQLIHDHYQPRLLQNIRPWTTKPVLSRWSIFVAIAKNTLYVSKLTKLN